MFCQKCGNQLNDGAAFCPKCGAKVDAASNIHIQGTNENSVNQRPMGGQSLNIQQPNQAFYTAPNPNSQGQVQYNKPIEKKHYMDKYRIIMIVGFILLVVGLLMGFVFPFTIVGMLMLLIAAAHRKMLLILFGIIVTLGGGGLIIYGYQLNDSLRSQAESIFSRGTTNPGNPYIIAGVVVLLIGLLLTITGIVNKAKSKQ